MALIKNLSIGISVKHDAFKKSMAEAGSTVSGFSSKTKSALYQLQQALEKDTVAATAFGKNAQQVLNSITTSAITTAGLTGAFSGAIPVLGNFQAAGVGAALAVSGGFKKTHAELRNLFATMGSNTLSGLLKDDKQLLAAMAATAGESGTIILAAMMNIKQQFISLGKAGLTAIKSIKGISTSLISLGKTSSIKIGAFLDPFRAKLLATKASIQNFLDPKAATFGQAFSNYLDEDFIGRGIKAIASQVAGFSAGLKDEFKRLGPAIKTELSPIGQAFMSFGSSSGQAIKSFTIGMKNDFINSLLDVKKAYATLGRTGLFAALTTSAGQEVASFVVGLRDEFSKLNPYVKTAVDAVSSTFGKLAPTLKSGFATAGTAVGAFAKRVKQEVKTIMIPYFAIAKVAVKEFGRAVSKVAGAVRSGMSKMADAVKSMATGISSSLLVVTAGIAAAGYAFVKFSMSAIKSAAAAEQTEVAFKTLFGSAAAGKAALDGLKQFADVTPFDTDEVIQAGKQLKAFGFNAADIVPTLTRIGDVSAGLSIDINRLTTTFGKAKVAGTLYAADINEFINAGVPIITELSKVMGVNENQVKKMGSEGKISFAVLEQAFKNMTGQGGDFGGLMAEQSKTLAGVFSNLRATIQRITTKIGTGIAAAFDLTSIVTRFNQFLVDFEKFTPVVIGVYESIKIAATDFLGAFSGAFGGISFSMETFIKGIKGLSFAVRSSVKIIQLVMLELELGMVKVFNNISFYLTEYLPAGFSYLYNNAKDIFTDIFNYVTSVIKNLGKNIVALIVNLPALLTGKLNLSDVLVPLDEGFQKIRKDFVAPIQQNSPLEETMTEMISGLKKSIKKDFDDVFSTLPEQADKVKKPLLDIFKDLFGSIGNVVGENIKSKVASVAGFVMSGVDVVKDALDKSKEKKDDKPASFSGTLFGSTDAMRKVIAPGATGVAAAKKDDMPKQQKKAIEAGNKLFGMAVGYLKTISTDKPPAFDF